MKYSREAAFLNEDRESILEDTNVIFIMSETFSDPIRMKGMEITGGDPISRYRTLPGRHGNSLAHVYGGGTANVEFEALTGISQEPLNGNISTPFIQLSQQMKNYPSINHIFANTGHLRTAIHAHSTKMYKRLDNYAALDFDQLIFSDTMHFTEKIDRNQNISDESAYKEVLKVMEDSEEKDFIHLVTMQNHASYEGKYDDVQYEVTGNVNSLNVEHYLKGLEYTDIATEKLIQEFDIHDENVMLIFWGDHQPGVYGNEIVEESGHRLMHETPLLIYTNFSDLDENLGTISPTYFINHVLNMTDTEVTPYVALLNRMERAIPAFEKTFYLERETGVKEKREDLLNSTQLLLEEYDLILYDITTGKNYSKELGLY